MCSFWEKENFYTLWNLKNHISNNPFYISPTWQYEIVDDHTRIIWLCNICKSYYLLGIPKLYITSVGQIMWFQNCSRAKPKSSQKDTHSSRRRYRFRENFATFSSYRLRVHIIIYILGKFTLPLQKFDSNFNCTETINSEKDPKRKHYILLIERRVDSTWSANVLSFDFIWRNWFWILFHNTNWSTRAFRQL